MQPNYIVIEVWPGEMSVDRDDLYNEIMKILGGGCDYETKPTWEDLLRLRERVDLDRVLIIGGTEKEEDDE